ncbi:MAG: phage integrase N-terminal SAM-like domain-containing protein [Verrucomicrobiae bacterium]
MDDDEQVEDQNDLEADEEEYEEKSHERPGILFRSGEQRKFRDSTVQGFDGAISIGLDTIQLSKGSQVFALKVRGDSMVNAGIYENDTVILEWKDPQHRDDVAALIRLKQPPQEAGLQGITDYLSYLALERNVSAATQKQALNAMVFLTRKVFGQTEFTLEKPIAGHTQRRPPTVMTREEVHMPEALMRKYPNACREWPWQFLLAFRRFEWLERTGLMGAVRPQTPHRSPRQAFGGNLEETVLGREQEVLAHLVGDVLNVEIWMRIHFLGWLLDSEADGRS